jgi:predicted membrane-bound spermidine synthase
LNASKLAFPGRRLALGAGLFSLGSQTFLARETLVATHGSTLAAPLVLSVWLLWVMAGALAGRAIGARVSGAARFVVVFLLAVLPAALLQLLAASDLRSLAGVAEAGVFPLGRLFVAILLVAAPVPWLTGALFPLLLATGKKGDVSALYLYETLGCFLGGAGFTLAVLLGAAPAAALGIAGLGFGLVLFGAPAAAGFGRKALWLARVGVALHLVASLCLTLGGSRIAASLSARQVDRLLPGATLLVAFDTPEARVTLARLPGQVVLLRNGDTLASYPDEVGATADVALAMAEVGREPPAAAESLSILLFGDGAEERARAWLRYPGVSSVHLVLRDEEALRRITPLLPPEVAVALADPRVHVHIADPRAWIAGSGTGPWDFVDLGGGRLGDSGDRLSTVDLYREVFNHLAPAGVVERRSFASANAMGEDVAAAGGSVWTSMKAVFPDVIVLPGEPAVFFARVPARPGEATATLLSDPDRLARRYLAQGGTDVVPPGAFRTLADPSRLAFVEETFEKPDPLGASLLHSDERPLGQALELLLQSRIAGGRGSAFLRAARATTAWPAWVPLWAGFGLLLWGGRRKVVASARSAIRKFGRRGVGPHNGPNLGGESGAASVEFEPARVAAVGLGAAGFASLSLAVVLLATFEARVGTLLRDLGLLNATLLAGMALGAGIGRKLASGRAGGEVARARGGGGRGFVLSLLALGLGAALLPALCGLVPSSVVRPGLLLVALFAGVLPGLVFPFGAKLSEKVADQAEPEAGGGGPGGLLFASDHVGGAIGGLWIGLLVLPLWGLGAACGLVTGVALAAASLVAIAGGRAVVPERRVLFAFPWPRLGFVMATACLTLVILGSWTSWRVDQPKVRLSETELSGLFPDDRFIEHDAPFIHQRGGDGLGRVVTASAAVRPDVEGYGGPIDVLLATTPDGHAERVEILQSRETPSYLERVIPWLAGFQGRDLSQNLALREDGGDVDAVAGATVTSRAVVEALDGTGAAVARDVLHRSDVEVRPQSRQPLPREALYLLVAFPLAFVVLRFGGARIRLAFLAVNLIVGGLLLNGQLSVANLSGLLQGRLPGLSNPATLVRLGALGLLTVLFGSAWCGGICPFGALQEALGHIGFGQRVGQMWDRRLRGAKYLLLAFLLVVAAFGGAEGVLDADPLSWTFLGWPSGLRLALLGLVLAASLLFFRFFCRYLCPLGALLTLLGRAPVLGRFMPVRRFGRCDFGVRHAGDMDCIRCNRCVDGGDWGRARGPVQTSPVAEAPRRRTTGLVVTLAAAATLLLAWMALQPATHAEAGSGRAFPVETYRRLIQENKLSSHEAEWWHAE